MAFQLCYGVGMVIAGRLIDKFGTKMGYGVSVILWSFAAMGHALAKGTLGFGYLEGIARGKRSRQLPCCHKSGSRMVPQERKCTGYRDI